MTILLEKRRNPDDEIDSINSALDLARIQYLYPPKVVRKDNSNYEGCTYGFLRVLQRASHMRENLSLQAK